MRYFLARRRTFVLTLAPLVMLILARSNPRVFWAGLPLVVAGELVRVWSAGCLSKLSTLSTAGPFSLCRNPLYMGSFLICVGYCVMCGRLDVSIVVIAAFWLFHGGAVAKEEGMLLEKFGQPYADYCSKVPRFLPFGRFPGEGRFTLQQMAANDEHVSALVSAVVVGLFAVRAFAGI